jgi:hypothetical protein
VTDPFGNRIELLQPNERESREVQPSDASG